MFATLSSFLPSALQQGSPNPANAPAKDPPPLADVEVAKPKEAVVDEGSTRRKEKRTNHEVRLDHPAFYPFSSPFTSSRSSSYGLLLPSPITL
jgi:hypothetical protein